MQAVRTRVLPVTNHRGQRIVAECDARRITVAWDYALGHEDNHHRAAIELASALDWLEDYGLAHGQLTDGSYAHVLVSKGRRT